MTGELYMERNHEVVKEQMLLDEYGELREPGWSSRMVHGTGDQETRTLADTLLASISEMDSGIPQRHLRM